ncbi:MAG: ribosome biogenesis GTP-binding protein YihA/YsxC [Defluviitaleaceae bacterium]|nr:ribosome biogenesis GTP-binding protein YihA/YsxC [Defluviitaleaceae bacterium]
MNITKAIYLKGATAEIHYPEEGLPEIMVTGRSNVGKSSFINSFTNHKALAKTSGKPGKTQVLNFFNISDKMHLVDVPGYGYAKVSKSIIEAFGQMIETYMTVRETLILGILLVDFRHEPSKEDVAMYELYQYYDMPTLVIGTKKDKVKRSLHAKHEEVIRVALGMDEADVFIPYSSETHDGRETVHEIIDDVLAQYQALVEEKK